MSHSPAESMAQVMEALRFVTRNMHGPIVAPYVRRLRVLCERVEAEPSDEHVAHAHHLLSECQRLSVQTSLG